MNKDNCYSIDLYSKMEDFDYGENISYGFYWSRLTEKIILLEERISLEYAFANLVREYLPSLDGIDDIELVKDYLFDNEVENINKGEFKVLYSHDNIEFEEIEVDAILRCKDYYLVKEKDDDGWQLGDLRENHLIVCFKYYEGLEQALKGM